MKTERLLKSKIHLLRNPNSGKPVRSTFLLSKRIAEEEGLMLPSVRDHDDLLFKSPCMVSITHILYRRRRERKFGRKEPDRVGIDSYLYLDVTSGIKLLHSYYTAWARELLVLPEKGGIFDGTRDIRDSLRDWTFRKEYIPADALGRTDAGILVDNYELERIPCKDGERIIIHPGEVTVIAGLPRGFGHHDPSTGLPRKTSEEDVADFFRGYQGLAISDTARRLLMRPPKIADPASETVAPVLKGLWLPGPLPEGPWLEAPFYDGRHAIMVADYSSVHGVGGVESAAQR